MFMKERLSCGLNLAAFEQLKLDNQKHTEKIETINVVREGSE